MLLNMLENSEGGRMIEVFLFLLWGAVCFGAGYIIGLFSIEGAIDEEGQA